jgi:hypothetical protein
VSLLDRALNARRSSRRIEIKESFHVDVQLIRDVAAIANSGGGVIVFRSGTIDVDAVLAALEEYTDFGDLHVESGALIVGEAITPIVIDGVVYFRRGGKSRAGTTEDLAHAIDRRVEMVRKSWQSAVTTFVKSPVGSAMPVRIVDDPRAPRYGVIDYDKTHPYRQKEILSTLRSQGVNINQFDFQAVRHAHDIDARPEYSHQTKFGIRQYSAKFLQWLLDRAHSDPEFFVNARREYQRKGERPSRPQ